MGVCDLRLRVSEITTARDVQRLVFNLVQQMSCNTRARKRNKKQKQKQPETLNPHKTQTPKP